MADSTGAAVLTAGLGFKGLSTIAGDVAGLNFVSTPKSVDPEPCDQAGTGSAGSSGSAGGSGGPDTCAGGSGSGSGSIMDLLELGSSGGAVSGSAITSGMQ